MSDQSEDVPEIDISTLEDDAVVLDVRERDEFAAGHAPSAICSPLADLPTSLGNVPHEGQLPVVCRSGGRSSQAVAWLRTQGVDAVSVTGGMQAWAEADKPLVASNDQEPQIS